MGNQQTSQRGVGELTWPRVAEHAGFRTSAGSKFPLPEFRLLQFPWRKGWPFSACFLFSGRKVKGYPSMDPNSKLWNSVLIDLNGLNKQ